MAQHYPQSVLFERAVRRQMDGLEDTRYIKQALPRIGVFVLSVFSSYSEESIAAGADGYLLEDCEPNNSFRG